MINLVTAFTLATATFLQVPQTAELDPVLKEMSNFVGGKWIAENQTPDGPFVVEFTYTWNPDKKGIRSDGIIGKGSKNPVSVLAMFGWDRQAKKVYYLDTHGSEAVYYGHITLDKKDLVFQFGYAGGDITKFQSKGSFVDKDTYQSRILDNKTNKEIIGLTFKRRR